MELIDLRLETGMDLRYLRRIGGSEEFKGVHMGIDQAMSLVHYPTRAVPKLLYDDIVLLASLAAHLLLTKYAAVSIGFDTSIGFVGFKPDEN